MWIAPIGAVVMTVVVLFAGGLLNRGAPDAQAGASMASAPQTSSQTNRAEPVARVVAEAAEPGSGALDNQEILTALQRATRGPDADEVTRSAPLAILEAAVAAEPEPELQAKPTNSLNAAAFFANAQANLANNTSCGEDLKALAGQTKIYFPAGGLTAEEAGLIQARVIGQIAANCPDYTLAVKGHSDPSGNAEVNLALSKQRAEAVIARLASAGIDTRSFMAVGAGDQEPSNIEGPKGSAYYDRRVDFEVIKNSRTASSAGFSQPFRSVVSNCARELENRVAQTRLFYSARSITASQGDLAVMQEIAQAVDQCPGARLRIVGQHSDDIADRESIETGRLRALILMVSMIEAGYDSEKLIIGAPSYSVAVPGQPSLPRSRIDFQIITD